MPEKRPESVWVMVIWSFGGKDSGHKSSRLKLLLRSLCKKRRFVKQIDNIGVYKDLAKRFKVW
jgi:hypothetical protein